ncbi:glutamate synthase, large subunit [Treponema primitia ZAS-2]|uniref:Glutamate synthase [NADPH] large chain n=1 Tax=Treponema primitia (strain ATCC BAA-887 / DSM 12427 / ZAS-2) TaxID=545694 RepID=F5YJ05_TREPZ|nr:glutamate synthase large subunit [Treponema primitia]AEF86357.1 glutamate synthase, large subunit [Treponema primitia ZAS-2]
MGQHEEEVDQRLQKGLYREEDEHDSCGIGFVADIKGRPSHEILKRGLEVLERMEHRGAESADNKTGDGSGVLIQIPHDFYKKFVPALPEAGNYGTGLVFLPGPAGDKKAEEKGAKILGLIDETAATAGLSVLGWRDVPTDTGVLGAIAQAAEPLTRQIFLGSQDQGAKRDGEGVSDLEFRLYIFRKSLEKRIREDPALENAGARGYMPSLSSRTIVYKGMLMSSQLQNYFPELKDEGLKTAVALVHSRFSTNTFPNWPLAQPFRIVSHNGEINTVKGNRFWMAAREALFAHPRFGAALKDLFPLIEPDQSDSASFDNVLELLIMSGRTLPHALMMLIPESWNDKNPIPQELKAFYEYHAAIMEPWDGPASMVFCDGRFVGGTLDRNGLRPSRYTITKDDLIVMASETGVQDFSPKEVVYKGRLRPGKLLMVDLLEGRIIPDDEVKRQVYQSKPYGDWVKRQIITLQQELTGEGQGVKFVDPQLKSDAKRLYMERVAGYSREDREKLLLVMAETSQEPTGSMGTDTPTAVFSDRSQRIYTYFKQVFAQVTNPPIDSIREDLVMTLTSFIGPQKNLLEETESHCRRIKVLNPIMTPADLETLKQVHPVDFKSRILDATFEVKNSELETGKVSRQLLKPALDNLIAEAIKAVKDGVSLLILSDRGALSPEAVPSGAAKTGRCAIPALLAVGAVHHGLIRAGQRMHLSIISESMEPREPMHFALLFGYGADLVVPYGALASLAAISAGPDGKRAGSFPEAKKHYIKGLNKAMLKVMSKMGTSTLRSYRGSQIFEAIGLGPEVIDTCFRGTPSRIGGAGFAELEGEVLDHYREARKAFIKTGDWPQGVDYLLNGDGQYRWRKFGEKHAWNPESIYLLQWATRTGDYKKFKEFSTLTNKLNQSPHVIRGLLDFAAPGTVKDGPAAPVPLEEVESVETLMRRFTTGAMSFGSISREAHETVARAMNSIHGRSNSGEGGESPERFAVRSDGSWLRSAIKQVASARFGVTSEYLANAEEIQIKIAQGAKPGEGGQLPGHKVDAMIAKVRHSTAGVTLISPPPHHDIYSIEDLAELIFDLKNANPQARISVKLVSESGVGTVAAGVAKAHADNILISGYDGGTGASPQSSIRHAGLPWELGLSETNQVLVKNGLRGRVRLMTDGQLKTGRDVVIAGMLGAEEFGFGTSTLINMGCVMMRKCHENTCPMGVATQDPELRKRFTGKPEYLINFFRFIAEEVREIMASVGIRKFDDLVGRADLLVERKSGKAKSAGVDLSALLYKPEGPAFIPGGQERRCVQDQVHNIGKVLDRQLIEKCFSALDKKIPAALSLPVRNTDRAVGAMLSYEVSKRFGGQGLPENFVTVDFTGSAGQSFGAFLAKGITFRLAGDSNDYLGKGLSGGRIVVAPPPGSTFETSENIIIGNTVLYGATSGELYAAGVAGERFCVRNSGATAVVEGAGDHAAEYMTGGRLIVLGTVGRNFGAGMSGGIAYVLDRKGDFEYFLNKGMVELSGLDNEEDESFVKQHIEQHIYWTGSAYAKNILDNWAEYKPKFVKVLPVEYKMALQQMKLAELDRKLYDIREREEISERV